MNKSKLPQRKSTRLKGYNYSEIGAYFLTICTLEHKCLLSHIYVGDGVLDVPNNILTEYGLIAKKHIEGMNNYYSYISIDNYVIMPNHIHILIRITDNKSGSSGTPNPTNSVIAQFVSTFKRFCNKEYGVNIWQRLSNDHIIRGDRDYKSVYNYIENNAFKWKNDCFYTEDLIG